MLERIRRQNAGNRMSKLIEEQVDKEDQDDEFYKNTYGGFDEEAEDGDYESEEEIEDIVDSDFSMSEHEEETESEEEDKGKKKKPKQKKGVKKVVKKDAKPKVKKPYVKKTPIIPVDKGSRMRATTLLKGAETENRKVMQSSGIKRHPRMPQMRRLTQEELLAEAQITEQHNTASLAQFLKLEEEKKNVKVTKTLFQGPIIRLKSVRMPDIEIDDNVKESFSCRNFLEFTDTKSFPKKYFPVTKVKYPAKPVCVVTGQPAKYKDPVTGLPYATIEAFRYIRQHRKRLKEKLSKVKSEEIRKRRKISVV